MKQIRFYLDFASAETYAAFDALPVALKGLSYSVHHLPVCRTMLQGANAEAAADAQHALALLAVACDPYGQPNRYLCESLLRCVLASGAREVDAAGVRWEQELSPLRDPRGASVLLQLQAHVRSARAAGIGDAPALQVDGRSFWGPDAVPRLRSYLDTGVGN